MPAALVLADARAAGRNLRPLRFAGMLEAGARIPEVSVWTDIREESRPLREVLGDGWSLLCFYVYDWSPT